MSGVTFDFPQEAVLTKGFFLLFFADVFLPGVRVCCGRLSPCSVPGLDTSLEGIKGMCWTWGSPGNRGSTSKALGDIKQANPSQYSERNRASPLQVKLFLSTVLLAAFALTPGLCKQN